MGKKPSQALNDPGGKMEKQSKPEQSPLTAKITGPCTVQRSLFHVFFVP